MIVVKLGGSILTNKAAGGAPEVRRGLVRRLGAELAAIARGAPLIVVLGAGSFGHPAALAAGIGSRRLAGPRLRRAVVAVQSSVALLRRAVVSELMDAGLPVVEVPGAALVQRAKVDVSPLLAWASRGFIPVTAGDVVPDAGLGARILSGDEIVDLAARASRARRAVYVTDVEGLMGPRGLVRRIHPGRFDPSVVDEGSDATGGMRGKLEAALRTASAGIPVWIVSAARGRLRAAALGRRVVGTLVG